MQQGHKSSEIKKYHFLVVFEAYKTEWNTHTHTHIVNIVQYLWLLKLKGPKREFTSDTFNDGHHLEVK